MSAVDHRYKLPRTLKEFKVVTSGAKKPLMLLALLQAFAGEPTLVFTSSLDATHKLYLLLVAVQEDPAAAAAIVEFSSHIPAKQRMLNLQRFKSGSATVLVASDAMTRGMDVENVANIINYDAPVYAKTYVHRAGRTARAGRSRGSCRWIARGFIMLYSRRRTP